MLPLKTMLFLGFLFSTAIAAVAYHPIIGLYAYLAAYNINPMNQWWGSFLPTLAERYSLILGVATALGFFLHYGKMSYKKVFESQEILLLVFLAIIWASVFLGTSYGSIHHNVFKMTKVILFLLIASHVITTLKLYEGMLWVLILSGLYLGIELYGGGGVFRRGRFEVGLGGSDFGESNFLAAHFALILPLLGVMFVKGTWTARSIFIPAAAFMMNGVVLTRSRGVFLALGIGILAVGWFGVCLGQRRKLLLGTLLLGFCGAIYLADSGFWLRMKTVQIEETKRDASAQSRVEIWKAAWEMSKDRPLGVGVNRFFESVGRYNPTFAGRDTHNTYLRCLAELGFHGFTVLLLLILTAFLTLTGVAGKAASVQDPKIKESFLLHVLGVRIALIVYLAAGMFISSVYIEEFYWLLMFPVFLKRALENATDNESEGGSDKVLTEERFAV